MIRVSIAQETYNRFQMDNSIQMQSEEANVYMAIVLYLVPFH